MAESVVLNISGRKIENPEVPGLLRSATRGVGEDAPADVFLPDGLLEANASVQVDGGVRGAEGAAPVPLSAGDGQVLVMELADGGTLITSPGRLEAALLRNRPDLVDPTSRRILFDRMNGESIVAQRGLAGNVLGGLVRQVVSLTVHGEKDPSITAFVLQAFPGVQAAELGVSRLGTKALMSAIESKLKGEAGKLYEWNEANPRLEQARPAAPQDIARKAQAQPTQAGMQPMLVFIHGTGSSTLGSFGDLQRGDRALWALLEGRFPGGIYGFEHRTLSESPIENAQQLLDQLPDGARVSLVTHSRGGLVGDLLCLTDLDQHVDSYRTAFVTGEHAAVPKELDETHEEQREALRKLFQTLRKKALVIERYVRVACPAQGTRLASGNFDVFLSGILTLIGHVPYFFGNPLYSAFKRIVIEIAKNRTDPHLVPGIEAMLPDSPMAALLRDAEVQPGIRMALIAGDIEGGNLLMRMGAMLTDFLLFENTDNDLVVDTASMLAGVAAKSRARVLFDRASDVSHFNYFRNLDSRGALRDWLVNDKPETLASFGELPLQFTTLDAAGIGLSRDAAAPAARRPVAVVLPGIMGTCLDADGKRVWLNPLALVAGGIQEIAFDAAKVSTGELFGMTYGAVCEYLGASHQVVPYPYDWRQPLNVLGERFAAFVEQLMAQTAQPIRLLAHSMGGLVVRAAIHRRREVMDALMRREGARLVMLGTPHQGAHSMVENLLGKGSSLRSLARVDVRHSMQDVLDVVARFPGAIALLPKPGFVDTFEGQEGGGVRQDYWEAQSWKDFRKQNTDRWFGDGLGGLPSADTLASGGWLWTQDGETMPALPAEYQAKSVYVFGVAANTPCGLRLEDGDEPRLRMVSTARGDGTVTWDSGRIGGIGSFYYLPAVHGDLLSTRDKFQALADLLIAGATGALDRTPPATRDTESARPLSYDAGPPAAIDGVNLAIALTGGSGGSRIAARPKRHLQVNLKAMDLRFLASPILIARYENDSMAGTEALVDRELMDGQLAQRQALGLYAGPLGTAAVILRAPSALDRRRGILSGAAVTGLGAYEGNLSQGALMLAVRAGVLRFLLQVIDVMGPEDREVSLATLLLGYNSSANLSVAASLEAVVRGVVDANERFVRTTGRKVSVGQLDILELHLDTAITAVYELRQLAPRLQRMAAPMGTLLTCNRELIQGIGVRQRLFDGRNTSYWPRMIVTDADHEDDDDCPSDADADAAQGSTRLANRLRFLYVGQRARAETVVQQRQPGLIEALVRQQIGSTAWDPDFGRMLFQLIVPADFKDAARQLQRIVLVVDSATANFPWELMLTNPLFEPEVRQAGALVPLAICTPVVRQLSSAVFRRDVRPSPARNAYVIGNPSVKGFGVAFPDEEGKPRTDPGALDGAQKESTAIADLLANADYTVTRSIGADCMASEVLARLYREPYRILHVSAHGVFDQRHVDGRRRSGVVLSGGLLITAAEIEAMECVPELVFLNCCHLGQVDRGAQDPHVTVRDGNKLAASVARALMQIGVRCVVVAGWAVDDGLARKFGEIFYEGLFQRRLSFGRAVFEARVALWEAQSDNVTWGAFQAYGDPLWRAEPRAVAGAAATEKEPFASLDEMLDILARARVEASRRPDQQVESDRQARIAFVRNAYEKRCPPAWRMLPALQSALGSTWRDLGCLDEAREAFLAAVQSVDLRGRVPIHDIELLAAVEIELGAQAACRDIAGIDEAEKWVDAGIARVRVLDALLSGKPEPGGNVERAALLGTGQKRKAALYALRLLKLPHDSAQRARWHKAMNDAMVESVKNYGLAQGTPGDDAFKPFSALNALALGVCLEGRDARHARLADVALARQCGLAVSRLCDAFTDPWDVVLNPESVLVERLCDGSLAAGGSSAEQALNGVRQTYRAALENLGPRARHIDTTIEHMETLATLLDARSMKDPTEACRPMADSLLEVVKLLRPGRAPCYTRPKASARPAPAAGPKARRAKGPAKP